MNAALVQDYVPTSVMRTTKILTSLIGRACQKVWLFSRCGSVISLVSLAGRQLREADAGNRTQNSTPDHVEQNAPSDMCAQRRLKLACASAQSDKSLRCLHDETLHPCLSKIRPVKILIRLRECVSKVRFLTLQLILKRTSFSKYVICIYYIQSTLVISNSKGLTETLREIRTSTYQSWESEENNKFNNHI